MSEVKQAAVVVVMLLAMIAGMLSVPKGELGVQIAAGIVEARR